ncbi:alpha/beta fold hydrolase [Roseibium sp. RKSG952]|uniref:alpha/beta fold hydrolase n=1 Tax=Roseibium sp. RKSG952 TaxID=2529384 RepID=UPI0012BC8799|nr:hypothetical protein [Roseibium sp. RKSG952]MTH95221.1 hypothetical protein [Roseibium sp. RKSG952]
MNVPFQMSLPKGYKALHPDQNLNFQLNRWLPYLPVDEVQLVANQIKSLPDFKPVMLAQARKAEAEDRRINAAFYYRAAEFVTPAKDKEKQVFYRKFRELFESQIPDDTYIRADITFDRGALPSLLIEPEGTQAVETLVVHGGFDSFVEELYPHVAICAQKGMRIIMFEGPGQGAALNVHGLAMIPDWHRPVAAILDHYGVTSCSLLGISLGGCLAL